MSYGIERTPPHPPDGCFRVETAARHFDVPVVRLKQYVREGLLVPLKSSRGIPYYTDSDHLWVSTIGRLLREAHLSFDEIRQLLAGYPCWKLRGCDFHSRSRCPLIKDPSKPCWVNRAICSALGCYLCYSCTVYRSAPDRKPVKALLKAPASGASSTTG
jgi:hypothetical protein